jgi:DNA repair protein RadD
VSLSPRDYQIEGIERVRNSARRGNRRILVIAPTGAGKTIFSAIIIASAVAKDSPCLFLAHRREIIGQTYSKLLEAGLSKSQLGVIMAQDARRNPVARVQIASVDTLRNRANKPPADLVFVDEAHRSTAATYQKIVSAYPKARIIGLTATPFRSDKKGFDQDYDDMVVISTVPELISKGWLVEPRVFTRPIEFLPDVSRVKTTGGDYNQGELAEAVDKAKLVGDIVEHWQRMANGRRTVCFTANVAHSKHIVEAFKAAGVRAEHLDGETDTVEREKILARLGSGETQLVANCAVLTEGWDQPAVKCAIMARPTKSLSLYLQCAGRIIRPYTDPDTGKQVEALILDHAGCAIAHGLPQDDREYSLAPPRKRGGGGGFSGSKSCPICFRVVSLATRECPSCQYEFVEIEPIPEVETRVELVEYTLEFKRSVWEDLVKTQEERGYKPGWAFYRFKMRFKHPPPKEFKPHDKTEWPEHEKRAYCRYLRTEADRKGHTVGWIFARYRAKFNEDPPLEIVRGAELREELAQGQEKQEMVDWNF